MKHRRVDLGSPSRPSLLTTRAVLITALTVTLFMGGGCPGPQRSPVDTMLYEGGGAWHLHLSQDGTGGVPAHYSSDRPFGAWDWFFQPDGVMQLRGFPKAVYTSIMPYRIVDDAIVLDGAVEVWWKEQRPKQDISFGGLEVGDVFGHLKVNEPLRPRDLGWSGYELKGSYVFSLTEEWGGETFSGTFEGSPFLISKQATEPEPLP